MFQVNWKFQPSGFFCFAVWASLLWPPKCNGLPHGDMAFFTPADLVSNYVLAFHLLINAAQASRTWRLEFWQKIACRGGKLAGVSIPSHHLHPHLNIRMVPKEGIIHFFPNSCGAQILRVQRLLRQPSEDRKDVGSLLVLRKSWVLASSRVHSELSFICKWNSEQGLLLQLLVMNFGSWWPHGHWMPLVSRLTHQTK